MNDDLIKAGDRLTMTGFVLWSPNPARKWWSFWRPKWVQTKEPGGEYVVTDARAAMPVRSCFDNIQ